MITRNDERIEALYERYDERLRAVFARRLGENLTDDAAGLFWERMMRAHDAGRSPRIDQVAKEVIYDLARRKAADPIPVGLEQDVRSAAFLPQELAEFPVTFDTAARGLESDDFAAFALTELRGLGLHEAADVLDTSHMTVYRRRERARLALREEIAA